MRFQEICRIPERTGHFRVTVEDGHIADIEPVKIQASGNSDLWFTPGLFDIQVNGMLGHNLSGEDLTEHKVTEINTELERRGTTRWCPTVTTQDPRIVERNLGILRRVIEGGAAANIACIHLEGHYISAEQGYRGVHMEKYIRDPDKGEFDRWQEAAGGHIGLFSLAPERRGAIDFITSLRAAGVRIGLVHHHAEHEKVLEAVAAGADLSSHLINGCASMIHRQHNIIWSQLSMDELWASFIADGFHIPYYTLRAAIKAKGAGRSLLVSDLAHLSGLPDGEYSKMEKTVVLKDGGLWVKGEGTNLLSGAVKTLEQDCSWLAANAGFTIEQALILASLNPARYLNREADLHLHPGKIGPFAVFEWRRPELLVREILR